MVGTRADKATKLCQSLGDEAAKLTNHLGNPIYYTQSSVLSIFALIPVCCILRGGTDAPYELLSWHPPVMSRAASASSDFPWSRSWWPSMIKDSSVPLLHGESNPRFSLLKVIPPQNHDFNKLPRLECASVDIPRLCNLCPWYSSGAPSEGGRRCKNSRVRVYREAGALAMASAERRERKGLRLHVITMIPNMLTFR